MTYFCFVSLIIISKLVLITNFPFRNRCTINTISTFIIIFICCYIIDNILYCSFISSVIILINLFRENIICSFLFLNNFCWLLFIISIFIQIRCLISIIICIQCYICVFIIMSLRHLLIMIKLYNIIFKFFPNGRFYCFGYFIRMFIILIIISCNATIFSRLCQYSP